MPGVCCCAPHCACTCAGCFCPAPMAAVHPASIAPPLGALFLFHNKDQCCSHDGDKEHVPKAIQNGEKGKTLWQRIKQEL